MLLYGKQSTADYVELRYKKSHITLRSCRVGLSSYLTTLIEIAACIPPDTKTKGFHPLVRSKNSQQWEHNLPFAVKDSRFI